MIASRVLVSTEEYVLTVSIPTVAHVKKDLKESTVKHV